MDSVESSTAAIAPQWFIDACSHKPESHYFLYEGVRLHYLHWPDNASPDTAKPTLIFCHGFRGHAYWWGFIAPFFAQHYNVYALDFSGMGDSDHLGAYVNATHPAEILAFIDHLGVSKVTAVCHSYAGGRAFRAAQQNSEVFERIVAIDSHVGFASDSQGSDPLPQFSRKYYGSLDEGAARFRVVPAQPKEMPWVKAYIARHSLRLEEGRWTWKFDPNLWIDTILNLEGKAVMAAVKCRVDYIYGGDSVVIDDERGNKIMSNAANKGRLIKIPGEHHHMMVSSPEVIIGVLKALL